jgi:hypothetical protein
MTFGRVFGEMPFNIIVQSFILASVVILSIYYPLKKSTQLFTLADLKNNLTIKLDEGGVKVSLKCPSEIVKACRIFYLRKLTAKQKHRSRMPRRCRHFSFLPGY